MFLFCFFTDAIGQIKFWSEDGARWKSGDNILASILTVVKSFHTTKVCIHSMIVPDFLPCSFWEPLSRLKIAFEFWGFAAFLCFLSKAIYKSKMSLLGKGFFFGSFPWWITIPNNWGISKKPGSLPGSGEAALLWPIIHWSHIVLVISVPDQKAKIACIF